MKTPYEPDQEIDAISTVYAALKELDPAAQKRVIEYVLKKLNLTSEVSRHVADDEGDEPITLPPQKLKESTDEDGKGKPDGELDGISPVAKKWMLRNGLQANRLSAIFSLGGDEIDLVAKKVPGKSIRARMHSVFLLKGVASYLSGGAPRFTYEQLKQVCLHYDAYDTTNFAAHLRGFAAEISGTKESGYTLNARGLSSATDLIKEMTAKEKTD